MFKFSFRQQVLLGFGISIILVLLVGILSYKSINQLESDSLMVDHTQKVIRTSNNLLQMMIDAETGMRGYVATNEKVFLDPYNAALPSVHSDIELLKSLIADNPIEVRRVDSISAFADAQLNTLKVNIDARPARGLDYMIKR